MGLLPDWMIERDLGDKIVPFSPGVKRPGVISYGLTSMGYDARIGYKFKVFDVIGGKEIDPKNFDPKALREVDLTALPHDYVEDKNGQPGTGYCKRCYNRIDGPDDYHCPINPINYILVPPHSFVLGETLEEFDIPRDMLCVVLGKSTLARCGLIINVTPLEPEWKGKVTVEISNTSPLPCRVYAGEGIMQCLFFRTDGYSEAVLNAVRRLCGPEFQKQAAMSVETSGLYRSALLIEELLHKELGKGSCRTSYKDKQGRYQGQSGLTLPTVDKD